MPHIAFLHTQSALRKNVRHQRLNTQNKHHIIFITDRRKVLVEVRVRVALQNRSHERNSLRSRSQVLPDNHGLNFVHKLEVLLTGATLEVWHLNLVDRRVFLCWIGTQLQGSVRTLGIRFFFFLDQWNRRHQRAKAL